MKKKHSGSSSVWRGTGGGEVSGSTPSCRAKILMWIGRRAFDIFIELPRCPWALLTPLLKRLHVAIVCWCIKHEWCLEWPEGKYRKFPAVGLIKHVLFHYFVADMLTSVNISRPFQQLRLHQLEVSYWTSVHLHILNNKVAPHPEDAWPDERRCVIRQFSALSHRFSSQTSPKGRSKPLGDIDLHGVSV